MDESESESECVIRKLCETWESMSQYTEYTIYNVMYSVHCTCVHVYMCTCNQKPLR